MSGGKVRLSAHRERELAALIAAGECEGAGEEARRAGREARDELILASRDFVQAAVASQLRRPIGRFLRGESFEDLVQQVYLVLLRKAAKFKPAIHGTRWSTYAAFWVKASLADSALAHPLVRVPKHQAERRARQNRGILDSGLGRGGLGRLEAAGHAMAGCSSLQSGEQGEVEDPRDHGASRARWRRVAALEEAAARLEGGEAVAYARRLLPCALRPMPAPEGYRRDLAVVLGKLFEAVEEWERGEVA